LALIAAPPSVIRQLGGHGVRRVGHASTVALCRVAQMA